MIKLMCQSYIDFFESPSYIILYARKKGGFICILNKYYEDLAGENPVMNRSPAT